MEEEVKPPQLPPTQISLSLDDLRSVLTQALAPIQLQVQSLKSEIEEVRKEAQNHQYASGVPESMRRRDPLVDGRHMEAARSVTIATRPVVEHPEDYSHVFDASSLVQKGD